MHTHANPPAKIMFGQVMHERLRPAVHRFVYPVFYVRVNLTRLTELNSFWFGVDRLRPVALKTRDYGARDGTDLLIWMRKLLHKHGINADGEIWLQTFPRLFGFVFNPVSFWYCYDQSGALLAVLAEVNNTFGQTHRYLLSHGSALDENSVVETNKNMHVSPFCQVKGHYCFKFRDTEDTSLVSLDYHDEDGLLIKTTLGGKIFPLSSERIRHALLKQPFLTLGIVAGIHWQAFKLWRKGVPFFKKPAVPDHDLCVSVSAQSRIHQEEPIS